MTADLESGAWDEKYGALRTHTTDDDATRLVMSR